MRDKKSEQLAARILKDLMQVRKDKELSHEKLATLTGLSRASISFIENGKRNPTLLSCIKIAKALDVDLGAIIQKHTQ